MIVSDLESKPGHYTKKDHDQQLNQVQIEQDFLLKSSLQVEEDAYDRMINDLSCSDKSKTKSTNKRELKKEHKMNKTLKLKPDPLQILQ